MTADRLDAETEARIREACPRSDMPTHDPFACHFCRIQRAAIKADREAVGRESDHHAADRGKMARTFSEIRDHINSDHPCCIPIGDACVLLAHADALAEALRHAKEWLDEEGCDCATAPVDPPCALCHATAALAAHDKLRGVEVRRG